MRAAAAAYAALPGDASAAREWAEAQAALQQRRDAAAAGLARRAAVQWEDWGEGSTRFFHQLAEERRTDSAIAALDVAVDTLAGDAGHQRTGAAAAAAGEVLPMRRVAGLPRRPRVCWRGDRRIL